MCVISIIIATYNAEKHLQGCINSIISQTNKEIELIIIDGASNDNTIKIIKENREFIDYWLSEPDNGIYEAWNKGLALANGDWIMFLGADDVLMPDAIQNYIEFLSQQNRKNLEYISSKVQMIDVAGRIIRIKGRPWKWPEVLRETNFVHPGSLHSKRFFEKYGKFDTSYKIVGDTELLLRAKSNLHYAFMNKVTVVMREGGVSDSLKAIRERYKATVKTGECSKIIAIIFAIVNSIKFIVKKSLRQIGINAYLKKSF